jgi:hypothetical protein
MTADSPPGPSRCSRQPMGRDAVERRSGHGNRAGRAC